MTSILDRFTGTDEPETPPMTTPRQGYRPASAVPWWAGVYGLDPAIPVTDDTLAAQCTAMACAVRVFETGAGYPMRMLSRKSVPAAQLMAWLLESGSAEGSVRRRLALRLVCDLNPEPDADGILEDARHLLDACSPVRK